MAEEASPRLYVGNLPYAAQRADIEDLFASNDIEIKNLDISIDPFTGRNPSYCFVDFHTEDEAQVSLNTLQGQLVRGRPVKINLKTDKKSKPTQQPIKTYDLGHKPKVLPAPTVSPSSMVFDRWTRQDAQSHWTSPTMENRRIYVGGLPRIPNQITLNAEMKDLFDGFSIEAVSKLISPHHTKRNEPGSHYHAFVDIATAEQVRDAVRTLNGQPTPYGGTYRISLAQRGKGSAIVQREQLDSTSRIFVGNLPNLQDVDAKLREVFKGHEVLNVGRLITPHASKQVGDSFRYCFVDFGSPGEAKAVVDAFEGNERGLKVRFAREWPRRGSVDRREESPKRDFGGSWRRRDG